MIGELLAKVNQVLSTKKITNRIKENDIASCEIINEKIVFKVKCSQCKTTIKCEKSNRWLYSNLTAHFIKDQVKKQSNNKNKNPSNQAGTVRIVTPNQSVLRSILSGPNHS